ATSCPELKDETVRLFRENVSDREPLRCHRTRRARHDHQSSSNHVYVRDLRNRNSSVNRVEMVHILLVQVTAISEADTEPATRINLDTAKHFNRVVIERIRCMTTDV